MSAGTDMLKHIVVLMMENRSFDHMLGFAGTEAWRINGLTGSESNEDSTRVRVNVSNDANYAGDLTPDPGHSGFDTLTQLYGDPNTPVTQDPNMSGFVQSYEGKTGDAQAAHRIMRCFSPQRLRVLTRLAQQFCLCNQWFSSLPGPTFPNRAFAHAATSMGRVDMSLDWRHLSPTVYERLADNDLDSVIYYHDTTMASTFDSLAGNSNFFGSFDDDFLQACDDNDLPPYSFIEPRFANSPGGNGQRAFCASDQHPDHDVQQGEALIQTVVNAIWKKAEVRNSTLLVIVYDEHGGTYDHVRPPATVNPDGKVWINPGRDVSQDPSFDFTRLGVRVPAVLVSPFIAPRIDSTLYDHSSIIATAFKHFLPDVAGVNLTKRDAAANTFEGNLTLDEPTNDTVDLGEKIQSRPPTAAELAQKPNEHLMMLVHQANLLEQRLPPDERSEIDLTSIDTEAKAAAYLRQVNSKIRKK